LNKVNEIAVKNAENIKENLEKIKILQRKVDMGQEIIPQVKTPIVAPVDDVQLQELDYRIRSIEI
jgi:hypothetical protein